MNDSTGKATYLTLPVLVLTLSGAFVPALRGQRNVAPMGARSFIEITSRLGISLQPAARPVTLPVAIRSNEYSLEYARRSLVPAMGGSIVIGDFDGDGRKDLYVIIPGGANHLFQNRADGAFVDVTETAKLGGYGADLSGAFADFDKSGRQSLFVAGLGGVTLYHNNSDGSFTDITQKAGLKGNAGELATSVLLFDADNDGFLDLLVTVYTDLSVAPSKSSFTFPNDFAGSNSRLYRNQHNGTFKEITETAGLTSNPGRTLKALAADFNHNGRLDLLLLRDNKPPALYRNQGRGVFEDKTWDAGAENWKYAYVDAQTSDFNHDGKLDVVLWSTIGNEVLVNQGSGTFKQDESLPLIYAANRSFGFHGMTADFNGDGYDDLLAVDDKGNWHFIVNHEGKFEEAPFALTPEIGLVFASMAAVRLGGSKEIDLIGLTVDGRVKIYEEERPRDAAHAAHSKDAK